MNPEGNYHGTPTELITGESSNGNPQVVAKFNVTHVSNGSEWEPLERPFERTVFLSMTDKAWEYSEKKLKLIGFDGNFDAPSFSQDGVDLRCYYDTYQGKTSEKWDIDTGGFEVKPASSDAIRSLNAKWKNSTPKPAASAPPSSKPAPVKREAVAAGGAGYPPIDESEIPFAPGFSRCCI